MTDNKPILWSFRRCPYAMRARLALASAQIDVEHREILLRDKPAAFLRASPQGTVPVIEKADENLIHSLDIMMWALALNDPEGWLDMPDQGFDLIDQADGPFKSALDHYKYASRYPEIDAADQRQKASEFIHLLNALLGEKNFLFGNDPSLADMAILPFVRQFAHVDLDWFNAQPWQNATGWLERFKASERFRNIMVKHPLWQDNSAMA